jgi:hypothetical protein
MIEKLRIFNVSFSNLSEKGWVARTQREMEKCRNNSGTEWAQVAGRNEGSIGSPDRRRGHLHARTFIHWDAILQSPIVSLTTVGLGVSVCVSRIMYYPLPPPQPANHDHPRHRLLPFSTSSLPASPTQVAFSAGFVDLAFSFLLLFKSVSRSIK